MNIYYICHADWDYFLTRNGNGCLFPPTQWCILTEQELDEETISRIHDCRPALVQAIADMEEAYLSEGEGPDYQMITDEIEKMLKKQIDNILRKKWISYTFLRMDRENRLFTLDNIEVNLEEFE